MVYFTTEIIYAYRLNKALGKGVNIILQDSINGLTEFAILLLQHEKALIKQWVFIW